MCKPLMSIVIPLYNKADSIQRTLSSILIQSFDKYEIIVVDDGSSDSSAEVVRSNDDSRIRMYSKRNGGPSSARNFGVNKANGEWILFLDADDQLLPNALCVFANMIDNHPEYDCYCANFYMSFGTRLKKYSHFYAHGVIKNPYEAWLKKKFMPRAGASIISKGLCEKFPYNETLRRYEDADVMRKIFSVAKIYSVPSPVMIYNLSSTDASSYRRDINEDYLGHLVPAYGGIWERLFVYDMYKKSIDGYKSAATVLYREEDFEDGNIARKYRYLQIRNMIVNQIERILSLLFDNGYDKENC